MSLTTAYGDSQLARLRSPLLFLPLDDEGFALLQYVDPYGKTSFNRTQIAAVVGELHRLMDRVPDELPPELADPEVAAIRGILELAQIVRTKPHLMLTLVGQ